MRLFVKRAVDYNHFEMIKMIIRSKTNLSERKRFGCGAASGTNRLFDQSHGEPLVRDAMAGRALILRFVAGQMEVYPQQYVLLHTRQSQHYT